MSEELTVLNNIYNILLQWQSFINFLTGLMQFLIVVIAIYALYKLLNFLF